MVISYHDLISPELFEGLGIDLTSHKKPEIFNTAANMKGEVISSPLSGYKKQYSFKDELEKSFKQQKAKKVFAEIKAMPLTEENQRSQAVAMEEYYEANIKNDREILETDKREIKDYIALIHKFTHYAATLRKESGQSHRNI